MGGEVVRLSAVVRAVTKAAGASPSHSHTGCISLVRGSPSGATVATVHQITGSTIGRASGSTSSRDAGVVGTLHLLSDGDD